MGAPRYTVPLQKIVTEQGLTVLHAAADYDAREISTAGAAACRLLQLF